MNWIKSNSFVAELAGITILLCGILYFFASKWGTQYDEAKANFEEVYGDVAKAENIPLYPVDNHRDGKRKALTEFRESIANLSKFFDTYRPKSTNNIASQAFTNRLLKANDEVIKAFGDTALPVNFFLGFESYRATMVKSESTGILLQQMDGIKTALLGLAKARPSALIKVFRVPVPEETGGTFRPAPNDIARYFSYEVTFKGSEKSARDFINSLGATNSKYFIIRTMRIMNERDTPPMVSDARFEKIDIEEKPPAPTNPFGEFLERPSEAEEKPPASGSGDSPPAEDDSRILAQVLGNEEIIVFVRFDIALFLPSRELPKP